MDDVIAKDLHYIKCISKHKYTLLSEVFFYAQHLFLFLLSMNKLTISQIYYFKTGKSHSLKRFYWILTYSVACIHYSLLSKVKNSRQWTTTTNWKCKCNFFFTSVTIIGNSTSSIKYTERTDGTQFSRTNKLLLETTPRFLILLTLNRIFFLPTNNSAF